MREFETVANDLNEFLRRRQGRKRTRPVTLPPISALAEEDRPLRAKVALAIGGDPLGILTGQYGERPRYNVDEVTPERMRHLRDGKKWLATESERFKDGRPTGIRRRRVKSQLEVWFERGVISRAAWLAAQAFQRDHDLSITAGGAMIAKYGPQMPQGLRELLPAEIRAEYQKSRNAAVRAVDAILHPILGWIAESSNSDVSAEDVAADFWPDLSERLRMTNFRALLEYTCAVLSRHYDLQERHGWVEMTTRKAAAELAAMLSV